MLDTDTIYKMPAPDSGGIIEIYGEPSMGWYEWRIIDGGRIVQDSGWEGRQYGQPEIALRDALLYCSPI